MRVVISGASGLIGSALADELRADGTDVVRLVRRPPAAPDEIGWDPLAGPSGLDPGALLGTDAVVHLSGAPIAAGRWTPARKAEMHASRIASTATLVSAMKAADPPPSVLLCGSAIGYYGDTADRPVDETAPGGAGFLADLVRDWENAAAVAAEAGIRVANLRSGLVLAPRGGLLARLLPPFRLGLGATIGSGRQFMSWISIADEVGAIRFLLGDHAASGPFNLTAPEPISNAEFTRALAAAVGRRAFFRLPGGLLAAALGEAAGELLVSARVLPGKLTEAGYRFRHPDIGTALAALLPR